MKWFSRLMRKAKRWVRRERRRFPRYAIAETDKVHAFFSLEGASAYIRDDSTPVEKPHPIINLSKGGMSLFLLEG